MIEIKGKYNEAKIFTDVVDSASIAQVQELCNQEFTAGSRIRLMPDIHAGAGCTIGTTMTITDKVVPNLVGVDIGCGMETTRIREGRLELQKLDKLIYEKIPSGFSIRDKAHRYLNEIDLSELCCARHVDLLRAEKSIGTLGGGNHFIEVDKDDEGNLYIVVHSGSRHLGVEVASYYQEAGYKVLNRTDDASIAQVQELCNQEFTAGSRIRLMPDIHAGAGCTIGTTMTITDKVVPNLVGVDIGCGMETTRIREGRLELQKLDKLIYEKIPSGFSIRDKAHRYLNEIDLSELCCARHVDLLRAEKSIGTLGGGNHFIEVDKDDEGNLYIVVHSGSRHLGVEVASYYQEAGYKVLNRTDDASIEALIARMKAEGREKEIQKELKKLKNLKQTNIPKALAYVSGELFEQYIHDMKIVQHFAMLNRQAMMDEIVKGMKLHVEEQFTTIHNYIDTDAMILRKGAVSAKEGERLLIPINMRDGSLLCVGKGNEDWNCSAPHGAGRLMSRADAKQSFTVSEFKKQMAEVYTTSVSKATLDECPMAYKGMQDILDNIGPTADVVKVIRPIYNFKAGDEE